MQMMGKKSWHLPWIVIATADKSTQFTTLHNGNLQSTAKKKICFLQHKHVFMFSISYTSPWHLQTSLLISSLHWQLYIQHVTTDQQSKASSNLYFDVTVQISIDKFKVVWVMHQRGEGSKRQLFVDKLHNQPVKLSNLQSASSRAIFFNKCTSIENIPFPKVNLRFSLKQACEVTKIDTPDIKCFLSQNQNKYLWLCCHSHSNKRKLG